MEHFDSLAQELMTDPDGLRKRIEADLLAKLGREWFDAHKAHLEADWAAAMALLGFGFDKSDGPIPLP